MKKIREQHYEHLTPEERVTVLLEAMARDDDSEAARLQRTCARFTYTMTDTVFIERMEAARIIALGVWLHINVLVERFRMLQIVCAMREPMCRLTLWHVENAFFEGLQAGRADTASRKSSASDVCVGDHDANATIDAALEKVESNLERYDKRIDDIFARMAKSTVMELVTVLEGLNQFCTDHLGIDSQTASAAYNHPWENVAFILHLYPDVQPDEEEATTWAKAIYKVWAREVGNVSRA